MVEERPNGIAPDRRDYGCDASLSESSLDPDTGCRQSVVGNSTSGSTTVLDPQHGADLLVIQTVRVHFDRVVNADFLHVEIPVLNRFLHQFVTLPVAGHDDGPTAIRSFALVFPAVTDGNVGEFGRDVGADVTPVYVVKKLR